MSMTDQELYEIAEKVVRRIFVQLTVTAHSNRDDIKAAVGKIDDAMNATGTQIVSAGYGATALETALLTEAQSVAPNLTTPEAGVALAYWALKRVGLI